jgi:hypothetical protein
MAEKDKDKPKVAADAGGGTHLDKLLKGLDALDKKLDSMGGRMDAFESKFASLKGKKDDDDDDDHSPAEAAAAVAKKDAEAPPPKEVSPPVAPVMKDDDDDDQAPPPPPAKKPPPPPGTGEPVPVAADKKKGEAKKDDDDDDDDEAPPPPPPKDKEVATDAVDLNALRKRMAALEKRMPKERSDHDLAPNQHACDSVDGMFGLQAPRPLIGDTATSYDLRQMERFKKHSPQWKGVDLAIMAVDEAALRTVRDQIYAAAKAAARDPASVPVGTLRAIQTRRDSGHLETRFMGSPASWMNRHAPNKRFVTAINLKKD